MVEQLGTSKPVSHIAQRNTSRRGSLASLNRSSSASAVHPLPVGDDVEAQRLHLLDFVLARRHDERHLGRGQDIEALLALA